MMMDHGMFKDGSQEVPPLLNYMTLILTSHTILQNNAAEITKAETTFSKAEAVRIMSKKYAEILEKSRMSQKNDGTATIPRPGTFDTISPHGKEKQKRMKTLFDQMLKSTPSAVLEKEKSENVNTDA